MGEYDRLVETELKKGTGDSNEKTPDPTETKLFDLLLKVKQRGIKTVSNSFGGPSDVTVEQVFAGVSALQERVKGAQGKREDLERTLEALERLAKGNESDEDHGILTGMARFIMKS